MNNYILDDSGKPKEEPDLLKWSRWFEAADRTVARDFVGDVLVSTVFLAADHSFGDGPPVLYETMIFRAPDYEDYQVRYTNQVDALAGHDQALAMVRDDES